MKKKNAIALVLGMMMTLPASAQWTNYDTQSTIRGVFGLANAALESAERKKEMEILARQKVEFEQSFQDAMTEAKTAEGSENWEEALGKYEEAAKLNCKYSYTEQRTISQKITSLYAKAGREDDGPSILHNAEVTLADYSAYRYVRENPVFVNKKNANGVKILRVACSNSETRVEMEVEAYSANLPVYIKGADQGQQGRQAGAGQRTERDDGTGQDLHSVALPEAALRPHLPCPARGSQGV